MQNVPNIVRERLKVLSQPVRHIEANMLAAFAERSLTDLDRDIVLEHLAQCAECREIAVLALPGPKAAPIMVSSSRGWLTWPTLRWGFAAAGIAVIVSFGVLRYQRHSNNVIATNLVPSKTAADRAPDNASAPPIAVPQPSSEPDAVSSRATVARSTLNPSNVTVSTSPTPRRDEASNEKLAITGRRLGQLSHGPKMTSNQLQQNANGFQMQAAPASSPAPFSKQQLVDDLKPRQAPASADALNVQVEADKSESAKNDAPKSLQQLVVHNEEISQQTSSYGTSELKRAKPADQNAMNGLAPKVPGPPQTAEGGVRGTKILPTPRWSIDASGSLQRSYDQGTTWQEVRVHEAPAVGGPIFNDAARAKSKDAPAEAAPSAKKETLPSPFRAVAANGNEVWAGAAGGLLYHSVDGGANWIRVIPSALGSSLNGDVVAIEFTDSQHGRVVTSTSQVWITLDDGQTWSKQQ